MKLSVSFRVRLAIALATAAMLAMGAVPAPEREAYLAFLGDVGTGGSDQERVRDQLLEVARLNRLEWIFFLGDNVYERGRREDFQEKFLDVYRLLIDGAPRVHSTLGNHDVRRCDRRLFDPDQRDGDAYPECDDVQAQLDPDTGFGYPEGRRYYSIVSDEGDPPLFEVFMLDTNTLPIRSYLSTGRPPDEAQLEWLQQALDDSRAIWKIVAFHNAMHTPDRSLWYSSRGSELALRDTLEPIFQEHGVDVVFQGHQHFYARIVPQLGIRYFVSGGGGKSVYRHKESDGYAVNLDGSRGKFHHFVHVRVTQQAFEYCTVDEDGAVRDAGWFRKGDPEDTLPEDGKCPFELTPRPPPEPRPSAEPVRVVIDTELGEIEVEVDPASAPLTVANFLRYVDEGFYDGGRFHRTVTLQNQPDNDVKQSLVQFPSGRASGIWVLWQGTRRRRRSSVVDDEKRRPGGPKP